MIRAATLLLVGIAVAACGRAHREPVGASVTCDQVVDHILAVELASPDTKRQLDALPPASRKQVADELAAKRPDMIAQCKAKRFSQDVLACSLRAADQRAVDACERGNADGAHPAVHAMDAIADEICACKPGDVACLGPAQEHAAAFLHAYGNARGSEEDRKQLDAATKRMTDCLAKQQGAVAEITCQTAAAHMVQVMLDASTSKDRVKTLSADDRAALKLQLEAQQADMERDCQREQWKPEGRACVMAAHDEDALARCEDLALGKQDGGAK